MEPINKFCPRFGKPVKPDSLTEYRGYTVGFCNPGCSSDFAKNFQASPNDTQYFDVLIKEKFGKYKVWIWLTRISRHEYK